MYSICLLICVSMYLYSYPAIHAISELAWEQFKVRLKMTIEWTQRYTWRQLLCELRDALGGCDRASLEMHLEAEIVQLRDTPGGCNWMSLRCTWRAWSSGDALGGRDRVTQRCTWRPWSCNWEMHLEAVIERVWRYTGWPWSSELRDAPGGCDRVNWEMYLEAAIERVWRCTWRPWSCELGGRDRSSLVMHLEAMIEWTQRCTWRPW